MSDDRSREAKRSIWWNRGRRFTSGINVLFSLVLFAAIVGMVNYVAYRYYWRYDIGGEGYFALSPKTKQIISSLNADIDVVVFFQRSHEQYDDIRFLLKEYEYEARKTSKVKFNLQFVDPDRDLGKAKELGQKYDVKDEGVVVFESAGRRRYVSGKDIVNYEYLMNTANKIEKKKTGFKGENAFSSAIQSVSQAQRPVVYFLVGHGERDISDFGAQSAGYAKVARMLQRDNIEVKTLMIAEHHGIPADCSMLLVAGPGKKISGPELDIITKYLERNGRAMFLLDSGTETGLEKLLADWGIMVGTGIVVGYSWTGQELIVNKYGEHPITRNLGNAVTTFYNPREIAPLKEQTKHDESQDKAIVSALAFNAPEGWVDMDTTRSATPRFDAGVDRRGLASVAVAVEKGRVEKVNVELKSSKIVVVGDSYFMSNAAMNSGGGGNEGFFLSAVNWLVEREALMAIPAKPVDQLLLGMNKRQTRLAFGLIVFAVPGLAALIGVMVWARRRR